jgi:hypothetical protein
MDNIIEIARFKDPADAQVLMSLLRSEGIECSLRNELSSQIMSGYADIGGAALEVLESDVPRALELMKAGGYPINDPDAENAKRLHKLASWADKIPFAKKLAPEIKIFTLLLAIALLATAILYICFIG